jgi:hypothetical protein
MGPAQTGARRLNIDRESQDDEDRGFFMVLCPSLRRTVVVALVASLTASACGGYSKETVSLYRDHVGMRVPNQQRLLALSTDEAVARLDFKPLAGKKVVVELNGVFPHTRQEVLDYIRGQVEGKIARDGGLVIAPQQVVVVPDDQPQGSAAPGQPQPPQPIPNATLSLTPSDADYRVVIGVSWAGVDTHDRLTVNSSLLDKQLIMMGGGLGGMIIGGVIAGNAGPGTTGAGGTTSSNSTDATLGAVIAGIGGLALMAGIGWYMFQRPTLHVYRLLGRVRVSVNALPIVPNGTAFQTVGEGQTELLIDPTADEGYILAQ